MLTCKKCPYIRMVDDLPKGKNPTFCILRMEPPIKENYRGRIGCFTTEQTLLELAKIYNRAYIGYVPD